MLTRATRSRLLGGLALTAVLLVTTVPAVGWADPPGAECPPGQHDCDVWDDDPGTPGSGGPGGGGPGGGDGGKCQWNGRTVPCHDEILGWFNNGDGCYYKVVEPRPADTPVGFDWYLLTCNGGDLGSQRTELRDTPPPGYGAPPDPEELARRALASIRLLPPRVAIAPRKDIGPGLVGLPVWMWASPGSTYFGPLRASAADRGLTVAIEAKVDRVVWDMGNGVRVTCTGPGTPYSSTGAHAGKPSPDCGYHRGYPTAGTYRVQATTHWTVRWWIDGGVEGEPIPQTRTSNIATIQINELQVVTE
ncbi:hypothetical protein QTQ03_20990 [Micromonospora sp. WMMA1363]|uniref:hypothetical protein n=1 Tax=Micromonospora sp. WMMA1363 TaxID=3053985 RepID=UPI00259CCF3E|nr:hypothetical protein [Micromonospora sp. WMMA1363]MDM4721952.1 hypothetical protein [Micromonospora sp. WMMA1363]